MSTVCLASDGITLLDYNGTLNFGLRGISADGKYVFGYVKDPGLIPSIFDGAWKSFGVSFASRSEVSVVSADGSTLVGGNGSKVWRRRGRQSLELPLPSDSVGAGAYLASFDGSVLVGASEGKDRVLSLISWREGVPSLLPIPGDSPTRRASASGISDDGRIVVGSALDDRRGLVTPVLWRDGVPETPTQSGYVLRDLTAVSPDGQSVFASVVSSSDPSGLYPAFEIRGGAIVRIFRPMHPKKDSAKLLAISEDSSVGFGMSSNRPVFFDGGGNPYDSRTLLGVLGLLTGDISDFYLQGMSRNGRAFWGLAVHSPGTANQLATLRLDNRAWPNILNPMPRVYPFIGDKVVNYVNLARPAPKGGLMVHLSSSNPRVLVPANVLIPQGKWFARFTIDARNTYQDDYQTSITASTDMNSVTASDVILTLQPRLDAPDRMKGGTESNCDLNTVALTPVVFQLYSSNPSVLAVPETVTAHWGSNPIHIKSYAVTKSTTVKITAKNRYYSVSRTVVVTP